MDDSTALDTEPTSIMAPCSQLSGRCPCHMNTMERHTRQYLAWS
jgi:hypothetical protein